MLTCVPAWARGAAIASQAFAILGVGVGLFTIVIGIRPRTLPDLVFHAGILAVLAAGLALAFRRTRLEGSAGGSSSTMSTVATAARWTVRICGMLQVLLGLAIWTGQADELINFHIAIGVLLVIALWTLAILAIGRSVPWLVLLAFVWGLLMPALGLTQDRRLPGSGHWAVQGLHVVVGPLAIGQAEMLARSILAAPARRSGQMVDSTVRSPPRCKA